MEEKKTQLSAESESQLKRLLKSRKFAEAEKLAEQLGVFDQLIDLLSTNEHYRQAFAILRKKGIESAKYPELEKRAEKMALRYHLNSTDVDQIELHYAHRKRFLVYLAEDLFFKGRKDEALSIVKRHQLHSLLEKKELKAVLDDHFEYTENPYLLEDLFQPLASVKDKKTKYLSLSDMGFSEADITIIESEEPFENLERAFEELSKAKWVALDTENSPQELPSVPASAELLQLASPSKVFLLNMNALKSERVITLLNGLFQNTSLLKLGYQFKEDLKKLQQNFERGQLYMRNFLDLGDLFSDLTGNKLTSLQNVCEKVLGENLSKEEQCTDWTHFPLRKAQVHYAALDVVVLGKLFDRLMQIHQFDLSKHIDNFGPDY